MAKIAITGSSGTVGKALIPRVSVAHEVIPIDLPGVDVLDTEKLNKALHGVDTVFHLAGVFGPAAEGKENWRSPHQDPANNQLFRNALKGLKMSAQDSSCTRVAFTLRIAYLTC
jgi:nucleoside-diphosphate-sugar epimerase